jgi:replicative DNA helicase
MTDKGKNDKDYYYARTNRQITAGAKYKYYGEREKLLIKNAVKTYGNEFASNLYIHEGIGNIDADAIKKTIEKHISLTGNKPIVVIDYLQILKPKDMRATDKQNADIAVTDLKIMSRHYKIPVVGVSSFNRDNYLAPVNMASFKESGAIEYSSDVLFGIQFEGMDNLSEYEGTDERRKNATKSDMLKKVDGWRKAKPRKIQLKILKNRNGEAQKSISYDYYAQFNWFTNERIAENRKVGG